MASIIGGLSVSKAMERKWTRFYLARWRLKARTERPMRPLSAAALLMEVATLGGRGTWAGVRRGITIVHELPLMLGDRRGSEGGGEVTVSVSEVDAEMSVVDAGTDGGGEFLSSDYIVQV